MKLTTLHETVGHWQEIYHPGHMNPKMRKKKKKQDLSFRIKGKKKISKGKKSKEDPKGGADEDRLHGKADINAGADEMRLHGKPGKVAGGELKSCQERPKGLAQRQIK
jgi:hypothetical protein